MTRNVFEEQRAQVRALMGTEAFERSAQERKKIEMRFAHLKRPPGLPPPATARDHRCLRRVPTGSNRAEPQEARPIGYARTTDTH